MIVTAPAGEIVGRAQNGVACFLGIPYAEAPIGPLRFTPPRRRARFDTPFEALTWGATPQRGIPMAVTAIPEPSVVGDDTLTLNIWAPEALKGPLPVLVYIHGGGYVAGSPASPWYDGTTFARDAVIFVSISYRLGAEGFAVIDGNANRGMQDWIRALEWVQDNISAFGGDPARVTIGGQSAGGGAVLTLLTSPVAQHLFARAVVLSGVDVSESIATVDRRTAALASSIGVAHSIEGLASIDPMRLQSAVVTWSNEELLRLVPVFGDGLLPVAIREGLASVGLDKPLLIGSTADEFDSPGFAELSGEVAPEPTEPRVTDVLFRATCSRTAAARSAGDAGTWLYAFTWASPILRGSAHCIDIPFFFDELEAEGVERLLGANAPLSLAALAHADLVDFVKGSEPDWPRAHGVRGDAARLYGDTSGVTVGAYDDVLPLID